MKEAATSPIVARALAFVTFVGHAPYFRYATGSPDNLGAKNKHVDV